MKRLFLLVLVAIMPYLAFAQNPNVYLSGDWSQSTAYPKSGLIFDMVVDALQSGDMTSDQGNMESGAVGGGCTYCPTGFTCICSDASNMLQETSKVWKNNASIKSVMGATGNSSVLWTLDLEANAAYQITLRYAALTGGFEDFRIQLYHGAQSYDFSTDTWGGAAVASYNNIGSAWATTNLYVNNGAIARAGAVIWISSISINQTIYFDDVQIHRLRSTGPTSAIGPYVMNPAVTADPVFGNNPSGQMRFADGPARATGTYFDGVDDKLSCTDAVCGGLFYPTQSWTQACKFQTGSNTAGAIWSQDDPSGSRGWDTTFAIGYLYSYIFGPSGNSYVSRVATSNVISSYVTQYTPVADGSSLLTMYFDGQAPNTISNALYPMNNATSDFLIGDRVSGATPFVGSIYHCSLYNKALDAIDASKWINPYFSGNNFNRGSYVTTCTQAASHATCSYENCRDGTPNACQAEGTGVEAIFGQQTELCPNNSFEANTGSDHAPLFTYWNVSGVATAYRGESKHGNIALRTHVTGVGNATVIDTDCISATSSTAYYGSFSGKQLMTRGGSLVHLILREFSDAACATFVDNLFMVNGWSAPQLSTNFSELGGTVTTGVGINSVQLEVQVYNGAPTEQDILIDTVSLKAGSYRTPWVHNSGAGTTTYNARDYRIRNTLADPIASTGAYPYATGFCTGGWFWTEGSATRGFLEAPGTAGNNNRWFVSMNNPTELDFAIFDSAGNYRFQYMGSVNDTNFTSGTWKYIEACSSNTGTLSVHHLNTNNNTWYDWPIPDNVGTGIQTGQTDYIKVGREGALDGYVHKIFVAPYNATYTFTDFNNGRSPPRPY